MTKILFYVSIIWAATLSLLIVFYRFTHLELTETQLFLKLWKVELCIFVAVVIAVICKRNDTKGN